MSAGTVSLAQAGPGVLVLKFPGYVKPGDSLALTFDTAVKSLRQIDVPASKTEVRVTNSNQQKLAQ